MIIYRQIDSLSNRPARKKFKPALLLVDAISEIPYLRFKKLVYLTIWFKLLL